MKTKLFPLFVLFVGLAVLATSCGPSTADASADTSNEAAPQSVVEGFYQWYLDYIGDRASGHFRNPLVDRAYQSSEHLTPEFVQKVDGIIASFDRAAYDPFLCAQDIPSQMLAGEADVIGDTATVTVHTDFVNHEFKVELVQVDGEWKISDVVCR
jgi:hypothetical protein